MQICILAVLTDKVMCHIDHRLRLEWFIFGIYCLRQKYNSSVIMGMIILSGGQCV